MDILGGSISMNADYDTRDSLRPSMKADITVGGMGIREAFNTFNTVQKLAPTSKGLSGKVSAKLTYSSLLGSDLMPVIKTISGGGRLQSEEITLVESAVYDRMKEILKLGDNYSNTFRDLSASFKISDGRIIVTPFNTKIGNIRMNIGGDQGIDQTINYVVKTEIPRSDLGSSVNSLIDNLSAQASLFGFSYKPSELIKVNVRISGTFLKPVVTPFFGNAPADSTPSIRETAGATVRQAIDSTISETKDRVRTEAEARAGKIVQEATEQGQKLRDEAARAAAKIRQEADQKGQALVKEAESKGTIAKLAAQKTADSLRKEADRKAEQLIQEADNQANKLVGEANAQKEEILSKIK
jgi:cell division septum initiation protein DivIVA